MNTDQHSDSAFKDPSIRSKAELLSSLPAEYGQTLLPQIQALVHKSGRKVIVLDDDPTGTQTIHSIPVLTEWQSEALSIELNNDLPAFYLLTNSRSLPLAQAQQLNTEIGRNLREAARRSQRDFVVISRSDSTLRGHFPGEVEALADALEQDFDGCILLPFFLEGGRYTIHDIHYVADGDTLHPAGETEFAKDSAFGYHASNLRQWVEEKTNGRTAAQDVVSISIDDLRLGGPERVAQRLVNMKKGAFCIVNAASYTDLEVFVQGLLTVEMQGKRFLYRTAASFVRVRAGITPRPLLEAKDLNLTAGGVLIIAGSYVPKTTTQLNELRARHTLVEIQLDVQTLLDKNQFQFALDNAARQIDEALTTGKNTLVYTSRQLVRGQDAESSLQIGQKVSESLVALARSVRVRPRCLIAKGGITSSDIATQGLNVKKALVMGQILPGVPVWQLGAESRYPGMPYVVFPGNVGGPTALADILSKLAK